MSIRVTDNLNCWLIGELEDAFDSQDDLAAQITLMNTYCGVGVDAHGIEVIEMYFNELMETAMRHNSTSGILFLAMKGSIDFQWVYRTFLDWAAAALDLEDDDDARACATLIRTMI